MAKTVSQEMPDDERRERLYKSVKACGGGEIAVETSHLIQAVGMEVAEKLIQTSAETMTLVSSTVSRTPKLRTTGICAVDRDEALEAIEAAIEAAKAPAPAPASVPEPEEDSDEV